MKIYTMIENFLTDKKKRGFTIAEMLVVVAIIALLAGTSGGIYLGTYKKGLVEASVKELLLTAKYARVIAIEQQSRCKMILEAEENQFYLVMDRFDEESGQVEEVTIRNQYCKPKRLRGDVEFEKLMITPQTADQMVETVEPRHISFWPNGTADEAVIQIGDGKYHYTLAVSASMGKAAVQFGTADKTKTATIDLDE